MVLRVALAFLAGFVVGWERENRGRPAGLRTTILTCVAAAVAMIVAEVLLVESARAGLTNAVRADPSRLGAGILTGIGFLGAGTIMRHENFVRGVTTAATLWFVTILGLAFGSGLFALGGLGLGLALLTLLLLPCFEKHVKSDWYATLTLTTTLTALAEVELKQSIETFGPSVQTMKLNYDLAKQQKTAICELKLKRLDRFELSSKIVTHFAQCPGVQQVDWA